MSIVNHHINKLIDNEDIGQLIMSFHGNKTFDIRKEEGFQTFDFPIYTNFHHLKGFLTCVFNYDYKIDLRVSLKKNKNRFIFDQFIMLIKSTKSENDILLTMTKDRISQYKKTNSIFAIKNLNILSELRMLHMELTLFVNGSSISIV
jgi:hypothetical protein